MMLDLSSPDLIPVAIDGRRVVFMKGHRGIYDLSFLYPKLMPALESFANVVEAEWFGSPPDVVICHSGLCGSTYLSRCMERPDTLIIREPSALAHLYGTPSFEDVTFAMSLLGRKYPDTAMNVVKTNLYAFNIALDTYAKVVCLMPSFESHMVAYLKSPERHRFAMSNRPHVKAKLKQLKKRVPKLLNHITTAALMWWIHDDMFRGIGSVLGSERFLRVKSEELYKFPLSTIAGVCSFLDLPGNHFEEGTKRASIFEAKTKRPFDRKRYEANLAKKSADLMPLIHETREWLERWKKD